jgi:glycosyltransferase involved in cell wall biosynthesis
LRNVAAGLERADVWVAPTYWYRDWIQDFYAPPREGEVIWNGIPHIEASADKHNVILAAGRLWDEAKNLAVVADIAPDLPWPVRLAGANRAENGGSIWFENVEQLGALAHAQLVQEMQRAAIFVSPALYEPFGLGVLEAASCGCALVLSDIGSFRELWQDAALFIDPRDNDAMTDVIQTLCRDDVLRARLQRRAAKRARRYSLQAMVNDYRWLYDRLSLSLQPQATRTPVYAEAGE